MKLQNKLSLLMESGTYLSVKKAALIIAAEFENAIRLDNKQQAKDIIDITKELVDKYNEKRIVNLLGILLQKMKSL